jgi:hypothetical protein
MIEIFGKILLFTLMIGFAILTGITIWKSHDHEK